MGDQVLDVRLDVLTSDGADSGGHLVAGEEAGELVGRLPVGLDRLSVRGWWPVGDAATRAGERQASPGLRWSDYPGAW